MNQFFRLTGFERPARFQEKAELSMSWCKLPAAWLDSYEFSELTRAEQGDLCKLHMLACRTKNCFPLDHVWLKSRLGMKGRASLNLAKFRDLGFLEIIPSGNAGTSALQMHLHLKNETRSQCGDSQSEVPLEEIEREKDFGASPSLSRTEKAKTLEAAGRTSYSPDLHDLSDGSLATALKILMDGEGNPEPD